MKPDAELHADAIAGGPEAFGPIVERYTDAVFGIALARVRDFHAAEDVAQSVLIAAYERLGSLKDPSRLGAWLRSMTIHHSIDHLRTRRPVAETQGPTMASSDEREPGVHLERKELRERVLAAIGQLSKAQRETTTLFYINGYTVAEVAAIQEMPLGTIKSRLHDARESLKEELIGMVEDVLKSEAPKEDFAARVFELMTRSAADDREYTRAWDEVIAELRRIGVKGVDGLRRALVSQNAAVRARVAKTLKARHAPLEADMAVELLAEALKDPNRKVRRHAAEAILSLDPPDEQMRAEIVALTVPLLADPSARVRQVASNLVRWAPYVPLDPAVRAFLAEKHAWTRRCMEHLLHAVLLAREGRFDQKHIWEALREATK